MQVRMVNTRDKDLPVSCRPTSLKTGLPWVVEDDAESQTWFLGLGKREVGFALKSV